MIDYTFTFEDLEFFLLVLTRISSFVFVAPFFSMTNTPRRLRAGFSLLVSVLLFNVLTDHSVPAYSTVLGYSIIVLKEASEIIIISIIGWLNYWTDRRLV